MATQLEQETLRVMRESVTLLTNTVAELAGPINALSEAVSGSASAATTPPPSE